MSGTTAPDPEAAAAARAAFPDAYAASGLPPQAYLPFYAQLGQESSYGAADSANPLRVTAATAANPGYGMAPMDPADLTNPSKAGSNISFGLRYAKALAAARGFNLTTPDGVASTMAAYNGGGDPNYVSHVAARLPDGSFKTAMAGASDVMNPMPRQAPQQPAAGGMAPVQPPSISYNPPPMPAALQSTLNDNSGLIGNNTSRDLLALSAGLLQGRTLGQGLGLGVQGLLEQTQEDRRNALTAYQGQLSLASQQLLAQRYAGQLGIAQQKTDIQGGALDEKVRHDGVNEGQSAIKLDQGGVKLDQGAQGLDIKQQQADTAAARAASSGAIGAANAETARDRAATAAANVGAPAPAPIARGSLPGFGAGGLFSGVPATPSAGAPQGLAGVVPGLSPVSPTGQSPQPPQATPTAAPGASSPPIPSPLSQGAGTLGLFQSQPQLSPPAASGMPSNSPAPGTSSPMPPAPAGFGADGFAPAGSIYDGEIGGLQGRRQTQNRVQASNHKENEADTSALEGMRTADDLANSQRTLLAKVQAANPGISGTGLLAKVQQFIATNTNDPDVQEVQKNASQLTAANYPHGVGALRIPELKVAADQAAGMGQNILAGGHLLDQQMANRAQMREVLQARQNFIASHPQEDPTVAFDPVATAYLNQHPAYTEGPNGIVPAQPGLMTFDRSHTNPATGRFDPNYAAAAAGAKALPNGGSQPADPEAASAASKAFPSPGSQPPATASSQPPVDPLTAQIRGRLQDPAFRQRALQARGQAWVDHYLQ